MRRVAPRRCPVLLFALALLAPILGACTGSRAADTSSAECRDAARALAGAEFALSDEILAHLDHDAAVEASAGAADAVAEHDRSKDELQELRAVSIVAEAEMRRVCG